MARWLPYHRDHYFQALQSAMQGMYRPQFTESDATKPTDPLTVRAIANRELDAFSNRADAAMRAYQQKKRGGR